MSSRGCRPNGKRIAWVSTEGTGHFNLFVADIGPDGLHKRSAFARERQSKIARYYYSTYDHALNPSWSPMASDPLRDNNEVAWGTGDIWTVAAIIHRIGAGAGERRPAWRRGPKPHPTASRCCWPVTTAGNGANCGDNARWRGAAPADLRRFDRSNARWSPMGSALR